MHCAVWSPLAAEEVSFNQDVRPILSNNCYACHGPDEEDRQADIRLDVPDVADLEEVVRRITSADPDEVMPPRDFNKRLSAAQIDTLRRWVESGGTYEEHWSFVPVRRVSVPSLAAGESGHPIDRFVRAELMERGLQPTERADKRTLIRRVTFDLTGLPPTLEEIADFLNDDSADSYEQLVDRLLDKPTIRRAHGQILVRPGSFRRYERFTPRPLS